MAITHRIIPTLSAQLVNKFWSKVKVADHSQCWEWQGARNHQGYGNFSINRKPYIAHRIAYKLRYKNDPQQLQVCHKCDNPSCCNPTHLFLGTNLDNVKDRDMKGRQSKTSLFKKGEMNPRAKLTSADVAKIRAKYKEYEYGYKKLAKEFNSHYANIRRIVKGLQW